MAKEKTPEWSNSVADEVEREARILTPREKHVASLIEKNKDAQPKTYNITSSNTKAMRVVYDFFGSTVSIQPGAKKEGIQLLPSIAAYLGRSGSDLKVEEMA